MSNCKNCNPKSHPITVPKTEVKPVNGGPGTELKKLLSGMGIHSTSGCKCSDRAKHIDFMETQIPGWTEQNIDEIVGWMEKEASNRGLPFIRAGAKLLVKLAIRRSKK